MYLLAPFILQNFKKAPELWACDIFRPKMVHLSWTKFFLVQTIIITFIYLLALFIVQNLKKNSSSGSRVMRMRNFWAQNGPFPQMRIFFRKPVNEPCFFHSCLSTCQKSKSDINLLVTYWRLKNTETSLTKSHFWLTWEPDFSQACSFRRMLMNHMNFRFT